MEQARDAGGRRRLCYEPPRLEMFDSDSCARGGNCTMGSHQISGYCATGTSASCSAGGNVNSGCQTGVAATGCANGSHYSGACSSGTGG